MGMRYLAIGGVIARVMGTLMGSRALVQIKASARDDPLLVRVPVNQPRESGSASSFNSWSAQWTTLFGTN